MLKAQNLIKNPSFESYAECPNALGTFHYQVTDWSTPTAGSSDYFNKCSKVMGAPENFNGVQEPQSGSAYAGIYFYAPADYREYVQAQLKFTLKEGQTYHFTCYASLAEGSDFAIKDFGIVLSESKLRLPTKKELSKGQLYSTKMRFQTFEVNHQKFNENKSNWFKVSFSFVAKGYEKYLTIGNLRDNRTTRKVQTKRKETKKGAYYYLDQLSLIRSGVEEDIALGYDRDSLYVFKNVQFEFDQFSLTPEALEELKAVKDALKENPGYQLEIHGHTDQMGTKAYNQKLSEQRARAVADYLLSGGVERKRIACFGHGDVKPLVSANDLGADAQNRRVEFVFKKRKR